MKVFYCPNGSFSVTMMLDYDELQDINHSLNALEVLTNEEQIMLEGSTYAFRKFKTKISEAAESLLKEHAELMQEDDPFIEEEF